MRKDLINLVKEVTELECRDNEVKFTNIERLKYLDRVIRSENLSVFGREGNLFSLYSKKAFEKLDKDVIVISTHSDVKNTTKKLFCKVDSPNHLSGTFDNSVTNAIAARLLSSFDDSDNIIVAFTGDEEEGMGGADEVCNYLRNNGFKPIVIVLDVTEEGYKKKAFSIENINADGKLTNILKSFAKCNIGKITIEPEDDDESLSYSQKGFTCFSFCIPCKVLSEKDDMHADDGLRIKKSTLYIYSEKLKELISIFLSYYK